MPTRLAPRSEPGPKSAAAQPPESAPAPRRSRYHSLREAPVRRPRLASALVESLRPGYRWVDLRADFQAALVVGIVGLPLYMALAIASGVRPEHGLYTAIVAGGLIALLGGSRVQVSGPTAAAVVVLAPLTASHGWPGLAIATLIAGVLLVGLGVFRLGRLIEYVPYPVTIGFTAGIAIVLASLQIKDFLGLSLAGVPSGFVERLILLAEAGYEHFARARSWTVIGDVAIGAIALTILLVWPRISRRVPGPLIAVPIATILALGANQFIPGMHVRTIADEFGGIPHGPPPLTAPWREPPPPAVAGGVGGAGLVGPPAPSAGLSRASMAVGLGAVQPLRFDTETIRTLISAGLAIALLGAMGSLLSATVADALVHTHHDPDAELLAQGLGNLVAPFFGGFAAAGAVARTGSNIRAGARTPLASFMHSLFLLAVMLALAPLLEHLPMSALAATVLVLARNMAEMKHVGFLVRFAPRSDVAVLLTCFGLTVIFDMVIAVSVGFMLAALLFMRRMAEIASIDLTSDDHPAQVGSLPASVLVLEVRGPLFFGAAAKTVATLERIDTRIRAVVMDLHHVHAMDATGLVNLDNAVTDLQRRGMLVVLAGLHDQPLELVRKAGWERRGGHLVVAGSLTAGAEIARAWVEG